MRSFFFIETGRTKRCAITNNLFLKPFSIIALLSEFYHTNDVVKQHSFGCPGSKTVPYWECGSNPDPGAWKFIIIYKQTWFPAFQKGFFTFIDMFLTYYLLLYVYFSSKKLTFCDFKLSLKSDQVPDS
jgi:hypothetical protein